MKTAYLALAFWGISLSFVSLEYLYSTLHFVGEIIIWLGSTVILIIGSMTWLVICFIAAYCIVVRYEEWK